MAARILHGCTCRRTPEGHTRHLGASTQIKNVKKIMTPYLNVDGEKSILGPVDNGLIVAAGGDFFLLQGRRGVA